MQSFEHGHIITHLSHIASKRQTGRSRAYNSYFNAILRSQFGRRNLSALTLVISSKTLQVADSNGFVPHLKMNALRLTLLFLWTYPTTNCRQCTGLFQYTGRLKKLTTFDIFNEARNIDTYRTTFRTSGVGAVQATFGLCQRLFFR